MSKLNCFGIRVFLIFPIFLSCFSVFSQTGNNDLTFNPENLNFDNGANNSIFSSALQSDGKILIGGEFTMYNGVEVNRIARLNADGTIDNTFSTGTGANGIVYAIALQTDGKILIAGDFTSYNATSRNRIARLNADGTLDTSFNPGTGVNGIVRAIAVQSNGRIMIAGGFTQYNGTGRNRIARVNTNGTIDTSFSPTTGANNEIYTIAIQDDGKIMIGGAFTQYNGTNRARIARVNANGSHDTTFNPGSGAWSPVWSIVIQPDGKILVAGAFTTFNGFTRNRIARLTTSGGLETAFNPGVGPNNIVFSIALQDDEKIVIGGQFTSYQSEGTPRNGIARINSNASLDLSFNPGTGANGIVRSINLLQDDKILVAGEFTSYNGLEKNRITRINGNCPTLNGTDVVVSNTAFTWIDGITYTQNNNTSTFSVLNETGCDSLVTLNLTIEPTVNFELNASNEEICLGEQITLAVGLLEGVLDDLDCNNPLFIGNLTAAYQTNATSVTLSYNNGNGGIHNGQVVQSAGVAGLTATLAAGSFLVGQGSLVYNITGTPNDSGIATFEINIGNQVCTLNLTIAPAPEYPAGYVHCNAASPTLVIDVTNPTTGKTWMDRNLGANRAAISSTDAESYGSLFQWGRFADGHQCVNRFSGDGVTTSNTTTTISTSATPGHGDFIVTINAHWETPVLNNLWQGVNGINNPCPEGYRLPTQSEMNAERLSWQQAPIDGENNISGAFASPLKFTMGGRRNNSNAALTNVGSYGSYWTSTAQAFEETSFDLFINLSNATVGWNHNRSTGVSVRCIKN